MHNLMRAVRPTDLFIAALVLGILFFLLYRANKGAPPAVEE